MKHKVLFVVLALLLCATLAIAREPIYDHFMHLPVVANSGNVLASTATPTRKILFPSMTPTLTATPTPRVTITNPREPIYDCFVYLSVIVGGAATPTPRPTLGPTPTLTPGRMTTLYWNAREMNGYPVCYEVLGTGIGRKCGAGTDLWRLYGTFPEGRYRVVFGSPGCRVQCYPKTFLARSVYHVLFCVPPCWLD